MPRSKASPSVSTHTALFAPRELEFRVPVEETKPVPNPASAVGERIRDALRRWFEEEL